ncbi:hypothetical protein GCM10010218_12520 [Streptomyces mashuensis]|uniref:Uncharacterized protein n=1 Tax=Streptomyces mashuensis TaxID=33904 RepID=A0A919AYR5_9ACTN|nr:hypothetical protein GCM10010218_12520 [Streptomyces mashuensis]
MSKRGLMVKVFVVMVVLLVVAVSRGGAPGAGTGVPVRGQGAPPAGEGGRRLPVRRW